MKWVPICLAFILIILIAFISIRQVREDHHKYDPMLEYLKQIVEPVHPKAKYLKLYAGEKSYTINKDKIYLCLKKKNGEYYPMNMLVYVLLHEMSHWLNHKDKGHTEEFHRIFDDLLIKATETGAFNPSIPIIQNYCEE